MLVLAILCLSFHTRVPLCSRQPDVLRARDISPSDLHFPGVRPRTVPNERNPKFRPEPLTPPSPPQPRARPQHPAAAPTPTDTPHTPHSPRPSAPYSCHSLPSSPPSTPLVQYPLVPKGWRHRCPHLHSWQGSPYWSPQRRPRA